MDGQKRNRVDSGPTGGQHFNGQAERIIGLIKKQIWRSFEGKKYSHEETITILQEAAHVINSRPMGHNPWPEGEPLCPQDLMLGRPHPGQPAVKFGTGRQLTRRFEKSATSKERILGQMDKRRFPRATETVKMDKRQKRCQSGRHSTQKR